MSTETPVSPPAAPRKPRSTFERAIVWGGILILLAIVGFEYTAKNAHLETMSRLQDQIHAIESTPPDLKAADFKASHVREMVDGKIPRVENVASRLLVNGGKQVEIYRWFSINPLRPREIFVYYGHGNDPDVLCITSEEEMETVLMQYPELTEAQKEEMVRNANDDPRMAWKKFRNENSTGVDRAPATGLDAGSDETRPAQSLEK